MSTLLELCQMAGRESGVVSGDQPASVTNQTGMLKRIVGWTVAAVKWVEQEEEGWFWMQKPWTGALTASNRAYTAASFSLTDWSAWHIDDLEQKKFTVSLYATATGVSDEQGLRFIEYIRWQSIFDLGTQTPGRPAFYTISPAGEIIFAPTPDVAYTARGLYRRAPQTLAANGDTPAWPAQFHDAAGWESARRAAAYDKAWDEALRCEAERDEIMSQLRRHQLPPIRIKSKKLA